MGVPVGHIPPPVHLLSPGRAASPGRRARSAPPGHVLKTATSRPSRTAEHLFPRGRPLAPSWFLSRPRGRYGAHKAPTESTQPGIRDSPPGSSLPHTTVSLMRKAVLPNRMTSDVITALPGGTCALVQTMPQAEVINNSREIQIESGS